MIDYSDVETQNYLTAGTQTVWYNDSIKDNNISELRVNALLKNKMNDTTTARVYGNARIDNLGVKNNAQYDNDGDGTFTNVARETYVGTNVYTDNNFNLGLACEHAVADGKAKVIVGLEAILDSRKWTYTALTNLAGSATADQVRWGSGSSYTEDALLVPFNVAIEAPIFDWLTGRLGAGSVLYNTDTAKDIYLRNVNGAGTAYQDSVAATNSVNWPQSIWLTYGLSAKANNLTVDLQINPGSLLNFAQNFAPGQGLLYGNSNFTGNNPTQNGNASTAQLFQTIMQTDVRYAF
jgi:hypothetical protein